MEDLEIFEQEYKEMLKQDEEEYNEVNMGFLGGAKGKKKTVRKTKETKTEFKTDSPVKKVTKKTVNSEKTTSRIKAKMSQSVKQVEIKTETNANGDISKTTTTDIKDTVRRIVELSESSDSDSP